jgi:adenine-specific DNA methylase
MSNCILPLSLKDAPALVERLLPVQKLSAEAYKEQMAGSSKTLTSLGSYWKGRKPLILNKACILGCLLPATDAPARDLVVELADYLARKLETSRPDEASAARILRELVRHQRLG